MKFDLPNSDLPFPDSDDQLPKLVKELIEKRNYYIDLFCRTFLTCHEPKTPEQLRQLFEVCDLTIEQGEGFSMKVSLELKSSFQAIPELDPNLISNLFKTQDETK